MIPINRYPIVLYLDEKYVFDVLATMEGGFSKLETVKTKESDQDDKSSTVGGKAGVSNLLNLFALSLNGERTSKTGNSTQREISVEKVHTANSLFARLRDTLYEQNYIVVDDFVKAQTGLFVEFKVTLQKNPLTGVFSAILQMMKLFNVIEPSTPKPQASKGPNLRQQLPRQNVGEKNPQNQLETLLRELASGDITDLIGTSVTDPAVKLVFTVDLAIANESVLTAMENGEYVVFGKVIKVIRSDSPDSINLLRKTNFAYLGPQIIDGLVESLKSAPVESVKLPDVVTEIKGPALQVIPIAIFS